MNIEAALQPGTNETKAQKAERLKREKNPWECLEEMRACARQGHGAIPEDWLKTYFKWWGVYTQGDGVGVRSRESRRVTAARMLLHGRRDGARQTGSQP